MEIILIMLPQPILISDEEIKEGDWYWDTLVSHLEKVGPLKMIGLADESSTKLIIQSSVGTTSPIKASRKIIAGIEGLPKLDLSLIADEIEWIDIESLAYEYYTAKDHIKVSDSFHWINGFRAAQSLNDNQFSLEDIKEAIRYGQNYPKMDRGEIPYMSDDDFIQSLSRHKEYLVEVEMEYWKTSGVYDQPDTLLEIPYPKITNDTIKVAKIL